MSSHSQFVGGGATKSIVNFYSAGGAQSGQTLQSGPASNSKDVLSGPLVAATLKTLLTVTGGGDMPILFVRTIDATSRTLRAVVTVDGVIVFSATSSAIAAFNQGMVIAGQMSSSTLVDAVPPGIRFNSSLLVEVASSLSETDKVALSYSLTTR